MRHAGTAASPIEKAKRLERWLATIENARSAMLRARAVHITSQHLMQTARATLYENYLIRGLRR